MIDSVSKPSEYPARNKKSSIQLVIWTLVWTITMVLADKAELFGWYKSDGMALLAIAINTAIGIGMIFAYLRFLKNQDELHRKIQLEALSLAMGVTLVGSFTYSLLVTTGFIVDAEISDIVLLMMFTYVVAVLVSHVRYR